MSTHVAPDVKVSGNQSLLEQLMSEVENVIYKGK